MITSSICRSLNPLAYSPTMPAAWKIIAHKRPKKIGGPTTREFYLVALPEKEAAVAVLRMREGYSDASLAVVGQAPAESVDWLDIKPGEVFCVCVTASL